MGRGKPVSGFPVSIENTVPGGVLVTAAAGAIAVLADRLVVMLRRHIVIGMTGSTVGLKCRRRPGHGLAIAAMTIGTRRVHPVVTRVGRR